MYIAHDVEWAVKERSYERRGHSVALRAGGVVR